MRNWRLSSLLRGRGVITSNEIDWNWLIFFLKIWAPWIGVWIRDLNKDLDRDYIRELNRDLHKDLNRDLDRDLDRDLNRDLNKDMNRDLDTSIGVWIRILGQWPRTEALPMLGICHLRYFNLAEFAHFPWFLLETVYICIMIFKNVSFLMDFGSRRISVLKNHKANTIGLQQNILLQTNSICLMIFRIFSILMDFGSRRISVLKNHQTNTIGFQQKKCCKPIVFV